MKVLKHLQNIGDNIITHRTVPCAISYGSLMRLTSVVFPNGISEIREGAFNECTALTNVSLNTDGSLKTIGVLAFYYCNNLVSIAIPPSVTSIGAFAFKNCASLVTVQFDGVDVNGNTIESQLTSFGRGTFELCTALKNNSVTNSNVFKIPNGVTYINKHLFLWCEELKEIIIPDNIISLDDISTDAFEYTNPQEDGIVELIEDSDINLRRFFERKHYTVRLRPRQATASSNYSLRHFVPENIDRNEVINNWIEQNVELTENIDESIINIAMMNYAY